MISAPAHGHPPGLTTLFFTEMWERFSFYGLRAILVLAMVAAVEGRNPGLGLSKEMASAVYGLYATGVYLTALPGGWIADRLLGLRNAVFYGGCIIALGHFTMAIPTTAGFYVGLVFIALGTGLLKPNISAMVGQLYPQGGAERDAGFSIFYMSINIGSLFGKLLCGYLGENVGWHYGFGAAGVFMLVGLAFYRLTGDRLGTIGLAPAASGDHAEARQRRRAWTLIAACLGVIALITLAAVGGHLVIDPIAVSKATGLIIVLLAAAYFGYVLLLGGLEAVEKQRVLAIIVLFFANAVFFAGFEQAGTSFNLFGKDYTDRVVFGWEMPAAWLQSINPLFVVILAPFFAAFWIQLGRHNLDPSVPVKFALGLLQVALGFLVLYFATQHVVAGDKVAPTWLLLTYLFHTTGELCLSPVGLSAVTRLAPRRYLGQMMGTWFMATSLGHIIAGLLAGHLASETHIETMPDRFLSVFLTTTAAGVLLLLVARPVTRLMASAR